MASTVDRREEKTEMLIAARKRQIGDEEDG